MQQQDPKVLVVGAGPVGLTLACELYRHGVPCRIIEQAPEPHQYSKAFAVHARTLEVFTQMGIADEMLAMGQKVEEANFFSGNKLFLRTTFKALNAPYPFFLALPQCHVEQILERQLNRLGGAVERNITLTQISQTTEGPTVTLKPGSESEETISPTWVIGCDGSRSTVRKLSDIPFEGNAYSMGFIVVDARVTWPGAAPGANTYLTDQGYLMLVPFPKKDYYRVVLDCPVEEQKQATSLEEVIRIKNAYGFTDLEITDPLWISRTNVQRRTVPSFRKGFVFLAGDAAHIHSPVGGQGLNTGIQDAHNLGWKLAYVCQGFSPPEMLDSYTEERYPVVADVLKRTDLLNRILTVKQPALKFLRNHLYAFLSSQKTVQHKMAKIAAGLDYHYRNSRFVQEDPAFLGAKKDMKRAGDMVPGRLWISDQPSGNPFTPLWRGTRHILLIFSGKDTSRKDYQKLKAIALAVNKEYSRQVVACLVRPDILPVSTNKQHLIHVSDPGGQYLRLFGEDKPCLYLIRPDGFIAYHSHHLQLEHLQDFLSTQFTGALVPAIPAEPVYFV